MAELAENQLHLWVGSVKAVRDDDHGLNEAGAVLSTEERQRAQRFLRSADRQLFVRAHVAVRRTLSRYCALPPAAWAFAPNPYGRPEITNSDAPEGLRFNLSHTPGMIAVVVHRTIDAGVDVEGIGRVADIASVSRVSFSPSEQELLHSQPVDEQEVWFARVWTLKEAFIKAKGMGLALPLRAFSFDPTDPADIGFTCDPEVDDDPNTWTFTVTQVSPTHMLATAAHRSPGPPDPAVSRFSLPIGGD